MVSILGISRLRQRRRGFSLTELVVCASMIATIMSFVASISIRVNRVWRDTRHQQIALDELSNQLEALTRLDLQAATARLEKLEVSPEAQSLLPGAKIAGEFLTTRDSTQLVLTLTLDAQRVSAVKRHRDYTLVGFLPTPNVEPTASGGGEQ